MQKLFSLFHTRLGKETIVGSVIVAIFLAWLFGGEIKTVQQSQSEFITGLEQENMQRYPHNPVKGEEFYREAEELVRIKNSRSRPTSVDHAKARALYLEAVRYGYIPAYGKLGDTYLDLMAGPLHPVDAVKLYERGIQLGDVNSMKGLGLALGKGLSSVLAKNEYRAVSLFEQAGNLGDVEAQYLAGTFYLGMNTLLYYGDFSIHPFTGRSEEKGLAWMNRAIAGGSTKPYYVMALYFKRTKDDIPRAEHYARAGAMKGNKDCLLELSSGYRGSGPAYGNDKQRSQCYDNLYYSQPFEETPIPNLDELCPPIKKVP